MGHIVSETEAESMDIERSHDLESVGRVLFEADIQKATEKP